MSETEWRLDVRDTTGGTISAWSRDTRWVVLEVQDLSEHGIVYLTAPELDTLIARLQQLRTRLPEQQ